jgi:hypothetical protein
MYQPQRLGSISLRIAPLCETSSDTDTLTAWTLADDSNQIGRLLGNNKMIHLKWRMVIALALASCGVDGAAQGQEQKAGEPVTSQPK